MSINIDCHRICIDMPFHFLLLRSGQETKRPSRYIQTFRDKHASIQSSGEAQGAARREC